MSKPETQQQAQQQAQQQHAPQQQHKPAAIEQEHGKLKVVGDIHPFGPAPEPYPLPEDEKDTPPWARAEFKRKVLSAGFPGSPASDDAFLAALYKFAGGGEAKNEKK